MFSNASQWIKLSAVAAVLLAGRAGVALGQSDSAASASSNIVTAYTDPSERVKLSFKMPGIAFSVPVKEGDQVKKGQLLIQQDDRMEQKQYESLHLQGESGLKVRAKQAELAKYSKELERIKDLRKQNVSSAVELEQAELNKALSEAEVDVSIEEKQVKKLEAEAMAIRLEQMKLTSTIDGEVEKIETREGELADPQKPSIIVVKNDPLWIVVNLPNRVADRLKKGDRLDVRYSDKDDPGFAEQQAWQKAEVTFLSPAGNAGAQKRLVRLTLGNPDNVSSGREIQVRIPEAAEQRTAGAR